MWQVLHKADIAQLLVARYQGEIITTWVLFKYGDTLYYPYGASTRAHREVMANNLVMWEAIRLAKKWGLKYLDMWGALGPDADPNDPWYGFHSSRDTEHAMLNILGHGTMWRNRCCTRFID